MGKAKKKCSIQKNWMKNIRKKKEWWEIAMKVTLIKREISNKL